MSTLELKELSHPAGEVIKIAAGKTLDLKSQGSVTMPTGSVLQVVSVDVDTLLSTTSTAWQTAMTATITPSSTSSKVMIIITSVIGVAGAASSGQSVWRDSTQILGGQVVTGATSSSGPTAYSGGSDANNNEGVAINGLDAPSTVSPVSYHFKYRSPQGSVVRVNDLGSASRNATYSQTSLSTITLMEVSA